MYCSACGVAVAQGLPYCNYCGAKLNGTGDNGRESPEVRPELLVSAMAGVFILGLVAITMLMGVMKVILRFEGGLILGIALVCFLMMLSLEGVFLRLLFSSKRSNQGSGDPVKLKGGQATKELDAANAGLLREPAPSVTDHTTRTLDPVHQERISK